jgi:hypothetical protein
MEKVMSLELKSCADEQTRVTQETAHITVLQISPTNITAREKLVNP